MKTKKNLVAFDYIIIILSYIAVSISLIAMNFPKFKNDNFFYVVGVISFVIMVYGFKDLMVDEKN